MCPAKLAGVPDALIFFCLLFLSERSGKSEVASELAGVPDALIFFCLLFFHQGKKRRWGIGGKAPNRFPHSAHHSTHAMSHFKYALLYEKVVFLRRATHPAGHRRL